MPQIILLVFLLVLIFAVFSYMTYRDHVKRTQAKKRNQYHDRV
jgi:preprotein translocase subunit YajC